MIFLRNLPRLDFGTHVLMTSADFKLSAQSRDREVDFDCLLLTVVHYPLKPGSQVSAVLYWQYSYYFSRSAKAACHKYTKPSIQSCVALTNEQAVDDIMEKFGRSRARSLSRRDSEKRNSLPAWEEEGEEGNMPCLEERRRSVSMSVEVLSALTSAMSEEERRRAQSQSKVEENWRQKELEAAWRARDTEVGRYLYSCFLPCFFFASYSTCCNRCNSSSMITPPCVAKTKCGSGTHAFDSSVAPRLERAHENSTACLPNDTFRSVFPCVCTSQLESCTTRCFTYTCLIWFS